MTKKEKKENKESSFNFSNLLTPSAILISAIVLYFRKQPFVIKPNAPNNLVPVIPDTVNINVNGTQRLIPAIPNPSSAPPPPPQQPSSAPPPPPPPPPPPAAQVDQTPNLLLSNMKTAKTGYKSQAGVSNVENMLGELKSVLSQSKPILRKTPKK